MKEIIVQLHKNVQMPFLFSSPYKVQVLSTVSAWICPFDVLNAFFLVLFQILTLFYMVYKLLFYIRFPKFYSVFILCFFHFWN